MAAACIAPPPRRRASPSQKTKMRLSQFGIIRWRNFGLDQYQKIIYNYNKMSRTGGV
jgi:hypothetical protein